MQRSYGYTGIVNTSGHPLVPPLLRSAEVAEFGRLGELNKHQKVGYPGWSGSLFEPAFIRLTSGDVADRCRAKQR